VTRRTISLEVMSWLGWQSYERQPFELPTALLARPASLSRLPPVQVASEGTRSAAQRPSSALRASRPPDACALEKIERPRDFEERARSDVVPSHLRSLHAF